MTKLKRYRKNNKYLKSKNPKQKLRLSYSKKKSKYKNRHDDDLTTLDKTSKSKKKLLINPSNKSLSASRSKCGNLNEFFHDDFFDMYKMENFFSNLTKKYPSKIQVQIISRTKGNNPIYLVRISEDSATEPPFTTFVEAGSNGCDLYSVSAALYLIDSLVKTSKLLMDYLIIPCVNPDAYIGVIKKEESDNYTLNLSNNYPVTLGLADTKAVSTDEFLEALEKWKDSQQFGARETSAVLNAICTYRFAIRLFISIQEDGEGIMYPFGFCNAQTGDIENVMKVAKAGQSSIQRRCFGVGSVFNLCGLTFGTVIDFLRFLCSSIKFAYIIHMNKKVKVPDPKNILGYSEDVANAIKSMTRCVYSLNSRENPQHRTCDT